MHAMDMTGVVYAGNIVYDGMQRLQHFM